ncbi:helix-turn-helix domain-containing protein [Winogradskyella tangerina]|uniref:helix-turn-helix domain-containing protein n=1 Tax=Winogradskyella tangerina TaxID=2023240 RepID=UPI000DBE3A71|nr:helix-turn-helix domain-containing protein [Winogradskyella tangerina]
MKIRVKNMVCDRCKSVLKQEFENSNIEVQQILLGEIQFSKVANKRIKEIRQILEKNGFELVETEIEKIVTKVKQLLIHYLNLQENKNLSDFLSIEFGKDYSFISKAFSKSEGITIEKYFIRLKIEKVKELIQMGDLNFSEIAYDLQYKNSSHLAKQFKSNTGMSMSDYKSLQKWDRKELDKIV